MRLVHRYVSVTQPDNQNVSDVPSPCQLSFAWYDSCHAANCVRCVWFTARLQHGTGFPVLAAGCDSPWQHSALRNVTLGCESLRTKQWMDSWMALQHQCNAGHVDECERERGVI
eukprot:364316-Chlamydomonas_euryale.AAC.12